MEVQSNLELFFKELSKSGVKGAKRQVKEDWKHANVNNFWRADFYVRRFKQKNFDLWLNMKDKIVTEISSS